MYSVYAWNMHGGITLIYSPDRVRDGYTLTSAKVVNESNKAGEFSFKISSNHPYYSHFRKIVTMIEVRQDDEVIWFGRVFEIRRDFYFNKIITCEGALSFLEDICLMPYRYLDSYTYDEVTKQYIKIPKSLTKWEHLNYIIDFYNKRCHESRKIHVSTNVLSELHTYPEISGVDSYNTILSEIRDNIIGDYNFQLVPSYSRGSGGIEVTVNIVQLPYAFSQQKIEFGKNLIDFEEFINAENIYSSIIPVGAGNISIFDDNGEDRESVLPITDRIYYITAGSSESDCGVIDKVVNFENIENKDDLREAGETVLANGGGKAVTKFSINAIDLHLLDVDVDAIRMGDSVNVVSPPHNIDEVFVCTKTDIDLLDPTASKYTFSTPEKTPPETLTEHLYDEISGVSRKMNQKLNMNQNYGVLNVGSDAVSLSLFMKKEGTSSG